MSIENPETRVMKWERFEIIIEKKKIEGGGGREGENEKKEHMIFATKSLKRENYCNCKAK